MAPRPDRPKGERPRRPFSRPDGPARGVGRRFDRSDRPSDRSDRPERSARPERSVRPERGVDRSERFNRSERPRLDRFDSEFPRPERPRFERSRPERSRPERAGVDRARPERLRIDRPAPSARGRRFSSPGERRYSSEPVLEPTADSNSSPEVDDLVWGRHSALASLESGRPIHRIWCTPEMKFSSRFLQLLREAKGSGVLVEEVTWARLAQLSGGAVHQGIVLQTAAAETLDLSTLVEGCSQLGEAPLLMAVDGLTDPQNLGAIVRSAEALGAHGLVLPQRRSAGLTGSVAKVAAGALEHLPVARVVNLNRALETLKQNGYRVVGLAEEGSVPLMDADLDGPLVVVTGSEGNGLSMLTRRHCDQLIRIPLRGVTPNLNAAVATALLLYELARRGWMAGIHGQDPAPRLQRVQLQTAPAEAIASPSDEQIGDGFSAEIRL